MWRSNSLACKSCHDTNHCSECRAFFQNSLTCKTIDTAKVAQKYPKTYKKVTLTAHLHNLSDPTACTYCDSKHCHSCSMYNTHFEPNEA